MGVIKKTIIFFVIVNTAIYVILIGFMLYLEKQANYDRVTNKLFYNNILRIENGDRIDWSKNRGVDHYRVYLEINQMWRAVVMDSSKWEPPMLSGYYPHGEVKERVAVVGKNLKGATYLDSDNKEWINCAGQEFRVIGTVGTDYATSCDDLVQLWGMNFEEVEFEHKVFIVDAKNTRHLSRIEKDLMKEYPEVQVQREIFKGTARFTKSSYFYRLLSIEMLFTILFSLIIFGNYRHEKYKNNYKLYRIFGLPTSEILIIEEVEILITNIISTVLSYGGACLAGGLTGVQIQEFLWIPIAITVTAGMLGFVLYLKERACLE